MTLKLKENFLSIKVFIGNSVVENWDRHSIDVCIKTVPKSFCKEKVGSNPDKKAIPIKLKKQTKIPKKIVRRA